MKQLWENRKVRLAVSSLFVLLISILVLNFVTSNGLLASTSPKKNQVNIDHITVKSIETEVGKGTNHLIQYINTIKKKSEEINTNKIRDPFLMKIAAKPVEIQKSTENKTKKNRPKVSISGIVWDKSNPYVIINGGIYEIGDIFEDYIVHSILDSMIILSNDHDIYPVDFIQE